MNNKKAREILEKYIEPYDKSNPRIALKASHIFRVADLSKKIATELGLAQEQIDLAELIGLLHDIGRFEQVRIYDTYNDKKSINHAELGVKILQKDNFIFKFCKEEKYHEIILTAIENHNKFKIKEDVTGEELLQSKIIRDADKVDILNILKYEKFETLCKKHEIRDEAISENVYNAFLEGRQVDRSEQKTNMDDWIGDIGLIFDINFKPSFKIIKENDYINQLVDRTKRPDMERIREFANKYVDGKIKEE